MSEKPKSAKLSIDKNNLDVECDQHSAQVRWWMRELATAKEALERAEAAHTLCKAEMRARVIESPGNFGVPSTGKAMTVDQINDALYRTPEYQDSKAKEIQARKNVGLIEAECEGLKAKGFNLSNMTQLHHDQYFTPERRASPEARESLNQQRQARLDAEVGDNAAIGDVNPERPPAPGRPRGK